MLPGEQRAYDQAQRDRFAEYGPDMTRRMLNEGKLGERKGKLARAWLAELDAATDAQQREIDRDIARGANRLAARALARSTWANIVATLALIAAMVAIALDWLKP